MRNINVTGKFELTYTQSTGVKTPQPETFEKSIERVIQKDLDANSDAKANIKVTVIRIESSLSEVSTDDLMNELKRRLI